MTRPYGLLRCGFPFVKSLGMRRLTNYPIDVALGDENRLYVLCRADNAALVRKYNYADEDLGAFGSVGTDDGQFMWPVSIITDSDENIFISDEYLNRISVFDPGGRVQGQLGRAGQRGGAARPRERHRVRRRGECVCLGYDEPPRAEVHEGRRVRRGFRGVRERQGAAEYAVGHRGG